MRKTRQDAENLLKCETLKSQINSNNDKCLSYQTVMPTQVTTLNYSLTKCIENGGRNKAFWEKKLQKDEAQSCYWEKFWKYSQWSINIFIKNLDMYAK